MGKRRVVRDVVRVGVAALVLAVLASGCAFVSRVSESSAPTTTDATTASGGSFATSLSTDGRFVAFESEAPDLVLGDTNGVIDVFVRDRSSGTVERASVSSSEAQATGTSYSPRITPDGRFVVFESSSADLVAGDSNGASDVFLRDRQAGTTIRASVLTSGVGANGNSYLPTVSSDGRFVVFQSGATNLVAGDTNAATDVFVRDTQTATTSRVSVGTGGVQGNGASVLPTVSTDGRYVAFESGATTLVSGDTNGAVDVFVRDRQAATTSRVSVGAASAQANGGSAAAEISGDGRYVSFESGATNLVGGDTNAVSDVFVRDRQTATTSRASVTSAGAQANGPSSEPAISSDGRYVSFSSLATNLDPAGTPAYTDVYRRDRTAGQTLLMSGIGNDEGGFSSISANGAVVGFTSAATNLAAFDDNGAYDVFVRVVSTSTTDLVSRYRTAQGNQGSASMDLSTDGRYVTYVSAASDLVPGDTNGVQDVFVRDMLTGTTERVSITSSGVGGNGTSDHPSISPNGRFVVFQSEATNFAANDANGLADIFLHDRDLDSTYRVSFASDGVNAPNERSFWPDVSSDGQFVAFQSFAKNMVPNDNNVGFSNIYVRDRTAATTTRVSVDTGGGDPNGGSSEPAMTLGGRFVVFESGASDLVAGDSNGQSDVFVTDRAFGTTTRASVTSAGVGGNLASESASITDDGRYVVFVSNASNLVAGDGNGVKDVFVRDTLTATTTRVTVSSSGAEANGEASSFTPTMSSDGRYVAFASSASNLVTGDTNSVFDAFVRDRTKGRTTRVSTNQDLAQVDFGALEAALSADGRYVGLYSQATNIVVPDVNGSQPDVLVRANPVPTTSSVAPASVARGATATITVNGTNFLPGVNALFGDRITLTNVNRVSEEQVKFTISVASNAATGNRNVIVYLSGTGPGTLTGAAAQFAFTVT